MFVKILSDVWNQRTAHFVNVIIEIRNNNYANDEIHECFKIWREDMRA